MKRQLFALAAGAILLVSPALSKMVTAQNAPTPAKTERSAKWKQFQQSLNITDAQKATLKQIGESTRAKMDAVLTADQKAQVQADRAAYKANKASGKKGMHHMGGQNSLNLTADQKASMKQIRQEAKAQMQAVYTPEQKAIMEQFRANNPRPAKNGAWKSMNPATPQ